MTKRAYLPQALRIVKIKDENTTTKTFVLDGSLDAQPGQFVMAWLPRLDEKPFSLANANPVVMTIAAVGPFSQALHQLQVGDYLWVRGPLGQGYQLPSGPAGVSTPFWSRGTLVTHWRWLWGCATTLFGWSGFGSRFSSLDDYWGAY
jgi:hypothetical protein